MVIRIKSGKKYGLGLRLTTYPFEDTYEVLGRVCKGEVVLKEGTGLANPSGRKYQSNK